MKKIAYHFVNETLRDGRPVPKDGVWLEHTGPVVMCSTGLHFSYEPFDALQYAPGPTLCMVEVENIVATEKDKGVCTRRKIIKRFDCTDILRYFARMQALSVVHLWDAPDVVLDFLMTGDESLRDAARAAARVAAWDAARVAARDAARVAARVAAWDAAWDAARDAARVAARDAARVAARIEFNSLVNAEFGSME